jgi:hypothetical protein
MAETVVENFFSRFSCIVFFFFISLAPISIFVILSLFYYCFMASARNIPGDVPFATDYELAKTSSDKLTRIREWGINRLSSVKNSQINLANGATYLPINSPLPFGNSKIQEFKDSRTCGRRIPQGNSCLKKPVNDFWVSANTLRVSARNERMSTRSLREPVRDSRASTRTMREPARNLRASTQGVRESARDLRASIQSMRKPARDLRASTRAMRESAHDLRASTQVMRESARDGRMSAKGLNLSAYGWRVSANQTGISTFSIIQIETFKK